MVQAVIATTVTGLQGRQVAATPAPTNNQALTWNGSAWVPAGPFLTAAGAPYVPENYCDNSGFTVSQRSYSSGTALPAGAYGFDRWKAGASGCTLTFSVSPASTVVTITAGTLQQVVEGAALINSSYTLSWIGSATGRVNTGTYAASPITFTGAPNTNVTIEFQGGTLGQVLLQIGTQATLWQPTPVQVNLARCQRFFVNMAGLQVSDYGAGGWGNVVGWSFPVAMRVTPTIVFTPGGTLTNLSSLTAGTNNNMTFFLVPTTTNTGSYSGGGSLTASADL